MKKTLITGWFSFEYMGATAGDLATRDLLRSWMHERGIVADVALAPPFEGGVRWDEVPPQDYDRLVFICGPFGENQLTRSLLDRFEHCQKIGMNLSMLQPFDEFQPFDLLLERDSERRARADLAFAAPFAPVPVVGLILVLPQKEYGPRAMHAEADAALRGLIDRHECVVHTIDTRLDDNSSGHTSARAIETAIACCDVVLTTRLHGTVLALKNGVPPIVIDPIRGGAKITAQIGVLDWPHLHAVESVTADALERSFEACRTDDARALAARCVERARRDIEDTRRSFEAFLDATPTRLEQAES